MPPDAITWLVGTLAVAMMGGVSATSVALIRRGGNGAVSKHDFDEFRVEMRASLIEVRSDVKAVGTKLENHMIYTYHQDG